MAMAMERDMGPSAMALGKPDDGPKKRMVGKYLVLETLGTGLQGKVKRGVDTESGEEVALKFIKKDEIKKSEKLMGHLEKEIKAMKKAVHPSVVSLRDVYMDAMLPRKHGGPDKERVLIVLDLAGGGELMNFLMFTGNFPESIAREYFRQLMAGVEHCHNHGVSHRDLKPENLLLDKRYRLKIADFGLSTFHENEDGTPNFLKTSCGTRGYMAPEIVAGRVYRGPPADVWSCGVILFIMLTGFPPFQVAAAGDWWFDRISEANYRRFWQAHLRTAVVSAGAIALLNKIFVADPDRRATVSDIKADVWVQEGAISEEALMADLARRREDVVEAKARERAEEKARKARTGGGGFDPFSGPIKRAASEVVDPELQAALDAAVAKPVPKGAIADSFHAVHLNGSAGAVLKRLKAALEAQGATTDLNVPSTKVKASLTSPGFAGKYGISAKVMKAPEAGIHVVDFKRVGGSAIKFHEAFEKVVKELDDMVVDLAAADAAPSIPEAPGGGGGGGGEAAALPDDSVSDEIPIM